MILIKHGDLAQTWHNFFLCFLFPGGVSFYNISFYIYFSFHCTVWCNRTWSLPLFFNIGLVWLGARRRFVVVVSWFIHTAVPRTFNLPVMYQAFWFYQLELAVVPLSTHGRMKFFVMQKSCTNFISGPEILQRKSIHLSAFGHVYAVACPVCVLSICLVALQCLISSYLLDIHFFSFLTLFLWKKACLSLRVKHVILNKKIYSWWHAQYGGWVTTKCHVSPLASSCELPFGEML